VKGCQNVRINQSAAARFCIDAHVASSQIKEAALEMDERRRVPKGTAFVEYETMDEAQQAISAMDGAQIDGNLVTVRFQAETLARRESPRRDDRERIYPCMRRSPRHA
jgi:RNA recognition motif-containing protein